MATPAASGAQASMSAPSDHWVQPELRIDAIASRATSAEMAGALSIPLGTYVRGSLALGAGPIWRSRDSGATERVDATARFTLDPFRQSRWAPYGIGGGSARHDRWNGWRPLLLLGV